ncbi:hypothetical protein OAM01_03205, partial [bacterium]|nr:hypothetical protein [bacterium]
MSNYPCGWSIEMIVNENVLFPVSRVPKEFSTLWQHQALADLRWIIDSPPLFKGPDGLIELGGGRTESLKLLSSMEPWQETPPSKRVGLY